MYLTEKVKRGASSSRNRIQPALNVVNELLTAQELTVEKILRYLNEGWAAMGAGEGVLAGKQFFTLIVSLC